MEARWQSKKDVSLPLLRKTPKSQRTAEQLSTKKCWTLTKKISYIQRQRRKSIIMMVGGHGCDKIKSHAHWGRGGVSQRLENNYITEVLPQEWKFWVPHQPSQTDGLATGVKPPESLALKASSVWSQDFHKTGGRRVHTGLCAPGPSDKSCDFIRAWADPLASTGGSPSVEAEAAGGH